MPGYYHSILLLRVEFQGHLWDRRSFGKSLTANGLNSDAGLPFFGKFSFKIRMTYAVNLIHDFSYSFKCKVSPGKLILVSVHPETVDLSVLREAKN